MDASTAACLARARASLDGLSVGDAFGETFVVHKSHIASRTPVPATPASPWRWTDDTAMAVSIMRELIAKGDVDEESLAKRFADTYTAEPWRGYGGTAHGILTAIADGVWWEKAARAPFSGQGSKGNGSAMRVAPIGAYFAHDLDRAAAVALRSAHPTHLHRDGEAGAIAVAVAAALAAKIAAGEWSRDPAEFLERIWALTPSSLTRDGIQLAMSLKADTPVAWAASKLGNGSRVCCDDTVPLCVWLAAHHLGRYEEAMWLTVSALGDMDTNAAIVGGILAAGGATIPAEWLASRETLPPI
ncbi:MAG TPA: ADP-ribosylglycohydrolase family protein [Kofleriaceae bacterium]|nr:ADP-ribosylglycohydrolase family protein [Kofleriaceae bacterium]